MRKRRRKVMIARAVVGVVGLALVFFIFYGIGKLTGPLFSGKTEPKITKGLPAGHFVRLHFHRAKPVSEMEQSGIERHCA